jgi:hypothetical protein
LRVKEAVAATRCDKTGWIEASRVSRSPPTVSATSSSRKSAQLLSAGWLQTVPLTTVAGNGSRGHSGDGGPAVSAGFNPITAIAADVTGNLFIAETINPRIRMVDTRGIVSTVAGDGRLRAEGDGGRAIAASLCGALSLAVDPSGNLYVSSGTGRMADAFLGGDYRVRKIAADGTISTVAGMGSPPRGMGGGSDPAPDGSSALRGGIWPALLAADGEGNLFINDARSVRKVAASGIITTVMAGAAGFGLGIDRAGNIFTTQTFNIVKINPAGVSTPFAGSGGRGSSVDGVQAIGSQLVSCATVAEVPRSLWTAAAISSSPRPTGASGRSHPKA